MSDKKRAGDAGEDLLGKALDRTLLRRILGCVWPQRRLLIAATLLLPLMSALELCQPYLLKKAIDDHIAVGHLPGLGTLALLYLVALVGQYVAGYFHLTLTQIAGQRAMNDLRLRLHAHVLGLAQSFFDRTPLGRVMTRVTSDIESLSEMFASGLVSLVGDVVKLTFILIAIFALDARLALFSLASAPVLLLIAAVFRKLVREAFRDVRTRLARMNAFLQEHLVGMKVVQAFARERQVARQFDEASRGYRDAAARSIFADAALYAIVEGVGSIAIAGLLWHGGHRIHGGTLTFGVLVAFIEYLAKFFAPIRDLSTKYTVMQQAMAGAERVFGLLDTKEMDASSSAAPSAPATPGAQLELRGVTFAYGTEAKPGPPILEDVSLVVRKGETLAVVGPSGAGKSTLVRLVTRLYDVPEGCGHIFLEGRDVRAMPAAELRRRIVVVAQDPFLFAGSLRDNVGLGDPTVSDDRMQSALLRVGAGHLLRRPEGLGLPVGERGTLLSTGERQLVAFARALCRDPEILVLDEATASVDPETERLIERGIDVLLEGRTSIVIAHRFSTLSRANRIVVVDGRTIAEEGTHDALMASNGVYARLARLQRASG